jgi:hypothetical protein
VRAIAALEVIGERDHIAALKRVSENDETDSIIRQAADKAVRQIEKRANSGPADSLQAPADDAANGEVVLGEKEVLEDQTLVATIFGKPLYLKDQTAATEAKRKELPRAEFDEWLRWYRGVRVYGAVWREVLPKYTEREKISVTKEDMDGIAASVDRRLKSSPELLKGTTFTPKERKGVMVAWQRGSLMDWKVCKSLYEKYGGRVGIGSLGAWTAFDGQNALLREHYKAATSSSTMLRWRKPFGNTPRSKTSPTLIRPASDSSDSSPRHRTCAISQMIVQRTKNRQRLTRTMTLTKALDRTPTDGSGPYQASDTVNQGIWHTLTRFNLQRQ